MSGGGSGEGVEVPCLGECRGVEAAVGRSCRGGVQGGDARCQCEIPKIPMNSPIPMDSTQNNPMHFRYYYLLLIFDQLSIFAFASFHLNFSSRR